MKRQTKKIISVLLAAATVLSLPAISASASAESYRSSENFSVTSGDGTWDNGRWSANRMNSDSDVYTTITNISEGMWKNTVAVGATQMFPPTGGVFEIGEMNNRCPVKTFNPPKTGFVTISFAEVENPNRNDRDAGKTLGVSATDPIKQMSFRVRIKTAEGQFSTVYPRSGDYVSSENTGAYSSTGIVEAGKLCAVAEIKNVNDALHFEIKKTVGNEENFAGAYCDPIVTYFDGSAAVIETDVVFKDGDNKVRDIKDIANAQNLTATVPVWSLSAMNNAAALVGVYDSDGVLVRVGLKPAVALAEKDVTDVQFTIGGAPTEITGGKAKVFIFKSLGELSPLIESTVIG